MYFRLCLEKSEWKAEIHDVCRVLNPGEYLDHFSFGEITYKSRIKFHCMTVNASVVWLDKMKSQYDCPVSQSQFPARLSAGPDTSLYWTFIDLDVFAK